MTAASAEHRAELPAILAEERRHRVVRRAVGWGLGLAVVAALTVTGVLLRGRHAAAGTVLRAEPVGLGDVVHEVSATGRIEARGTVSVGPEISGRIVAVEVDFNDRVRRGQVLARFDTSALRAQLDEVEASLRSARVALHSAELAAARTRREFDRVAPLRAQGMVSEEEYDAAQDADRQAVEQVEAARATLALQQASRALARTNLEHAEIRAPIDGVVITRAVDPGQAVAAALQSPELFVIAEDLGKMRVTADIDEADVGQVAVGQAAHFTVDAFPDQTFVAALTELHSAPKVTQDVVTYEAALAVENPEHHLLPGMTASVKVVTGTAHQAMVVPNAALRFTPTGHSRPAAHGVWVAGESPRFVAVEAMVTDGTRTAVRGELQVGDKVLVGEGEAPR